MALRAYCILALVAVTWAPGLAQEGGTYVQPKQGGGYVEPKQGGIQVEPKEEGIFVNPRQACGGSLTVDSNGETITSPGYPDNYGNKQRCYWKIKAKNEGDNLEVECSDFSLVSSRACRGDRMMIFEGRVLVDRYCGTDAPYYISEGNTIKITFRTNRRRTAKGFSCLVRSLSTSTENPTTDDPAETEEPTEPTNNTGECACGVANPSRIVGGQEVDPKHKYPWQVGLKNTGGRNYWCGGAIINDLYVLTAAHCLSDGNGNNESPEGLVVGVADHNMYFPTDDISGVTRLVGVEKVIVHPSYSSRTMENDIALVKLSEKLDLSQHKQLRAVCLPSDDSKTYAGVMATASGWGTTQSGGRQPSVLHEVSVPILEPSCWGTRGVTETMLCAGLREGGKDTCQGDSGGPLYVQENNKYVQVGITSWGRGCAAENSPGVYARVTKFLSWIRTNTADATYCQ